MSCHHIITISTFVQIVVFVLESNLGSRLYLGLLNHMPTAAVGKGWAISLLWGLPALKREEQIVRLFDSILSDTWKRQIGQEQLFHNINFLHRRPGLR